MIHVWFELPNGDRLGRQCVTVPRKGERVKIDATPADQHKREYRSFRVAEVENVIAERSRYLKVICWLEAEFPEDEMPGTRWFNGDVNGHHFVLPVDPYVNKDAYLSMDGHPVAIVRVSRLRDGGTTIIETFGGTLTIPKRLGRSPEENIPTWRAK